MRTIVFTNNKEYSYELVEHYNKLGIFSFHHYLINHRVVNMIQDDLELFKNLNNELVVVVFYTHNELLDYAKEVLKVDYELEVV